MQEHDRIIALLEHIEQNQTRALALQEEHLSLAREQMIKTEKRVDESIELQKVSVSRQARALTILLPLILVLSAIALYLMLR